MLLLAQNLDASRVGFSVNMATIRTATQEDLEELHDLFCKMDIAELGSPMTSKTDVRNVLAESDVGAWVAITANQIVAFGALRRLSKSEEMRAQLACLPGYVNAATEMLEQLVIKARANGAHVSSL